MDDQSMDDESRCYVRCGERWTLACTPERLDAVLDFYRFASFKTPETCLLHIRVRAFAAFGDEAVDPRRDKGQRHRAELEHGIVESADVGFETRSLPALRPSYPRR